jgi:hypothetical protein
VWILVLELEIGFVIQEGQNLNPAIFSKLVESTSPTLFLQGPSGVVWCGVVWFGLVWLKEF